MASYPRRIKRELLRINQQWYTTGVPEWLPFLRGSEEGFLRVDVETPPGLFEQATEQHRRQALEKLARYRKSSTRDMAKETAKHMMYANLACQCFNQAMGQDPLRDLPFPVE
jgi:hypothetical protein